MSYGTAVETTCAALSVAFANAVDKRDYDRVRELFTGDAVIERWGRTYSGIDAIIEMLSARKPHIHVRHFCCNIEISPLNDDEARGITYFLFFRGNEGELERVSAPSLVGEYHDVFARTPSGWRISQREIRIIFGQAP